MTISSNIQDILIKLYCISQDFHSHMCTSRVNICLWCFGQYF